MTNSTLKRSRSNSIKRRKSKSKNNKVEKKRRSKTKNKRKNKRTKKGGRTSKKTLRSRTIGKYNILTDNNEKISLSCSICNGKIFHNRLMILGKRSKFWAMFSPIFNAKSRLVKCVNCSHTLIFSKNREMHIGNA